MKRWAVALLLVALASGGCKGEKAPAGTAGGAKASSPARSGGARAAPAEPSTYVLTAEKLEAYVRYQRTLVSLYDALLRDLDKLPPPPAPKPGGKGGAAQAGAGTQAAAAMKVLEGKARAEEKARAEAGLSERDAREIEKMVTAILNKRSLGREFDPTPAIKQWEAMREKVPPDQRAELDQTINALKAQQQETLGLTEERQQFGDANVDLVLTREGELAASYKAYVAKLTGGK